MDKQSQGDDADVDGDEVDVGNAAVARFGGVGSPVEDQRATDSQLGYRSRMTGPVNSNRPWLCFEHVAGG